MRSEWLEVPSILSQHFRLSWLGRSAALASAVEPANAVSISCLHDLWTAFAGAFSFSSADWALPSIA